MPVTQAVDAQFTFNSGLNSEASYFTFPPNTWKGGSNLIPNINGVLSKRPSIDFEDGWVPSTLFCDITNRNQWAFITDKWLAVNGNGDVNFVVAQFGRYVTFYLDSAIATSATLKPFTIDLQTYKAPNNPSVIGTNPIKASSADGKCIISCSDIDPILVSYDGVTDTFTVARIEIKIRDFKGVKDGLKVDERPTTLSTEHKYNLYNQGWTDTQINTFFTSQTKYPSNAQTWTYGKNVDDVFDAALLMKQDFGTSPAPKGRYILNAFNEDRSTASGIAGLPLVTEKFRPAVCAFFAGRAWYAGTKSEHLGAAIYFSQIATEEDKYGLCYQDADPTSEIISDLIDTDGGVIFIQDCGEVVDIVSQSNGIMVLASNGVWHIAGTSTGGFTASGYEVIKISAYGCIGRLTAVNAEDSIVFWSHSAICELSLDADSGAPSVKSLTELSIKSLYNKIPPIARKYASGAYNGSLGTVLWLYNRNLVDSDVPFLWSKTDALVLDVRLNAFYTLAVASASTLPYICDIVVTKETLDTLVDVNVVDNSELLVVDNTAAPNEQPIIATRDVTTASSRQYKYFTIYESTPNQYRATFSDGLTTLDAPAKWRDWYGYDGVGVPYDTYLITGYAIPPSIPGGKMQVPYIHTFMERTETGFDVSYNAMNGSSCLMSSRWDFTDTDVAGKWSAPQQIYRHTRMFIPSSPASFNDGYPVVTTKNKMRGRGRALQLKFEGEHDYDMRLFGWSAVHTGTT